MRLAGANGGPGQLLLVWAGKANLQTFFVVRPVSWDNVLGQRTPMSTQGALETQRGASFDMYLIDDAPLSHRGENVSETGFNVLIYNLRFPDAGLSLGAGFRRPAGWFRVP
jgi:hypothetical protein